MLFLFFLINSIVWSPFFHHIYFSNFSRILPLIFHKIVLRFCNISFFQKLPHQFGQQKPAAISSTTCCRMKTVDRPMSQANTKEKIRYQRGYLFGRARQYNRTSCSCSGWKAADSPDCQWNKASQEDERSGNFPQAPDGYSWLGKIQKTGNRSDEPSDLQKDNGKNNPFRFRLPEHSLRSRKITDQINIHKA